MEREHESETIETILDDAIDQLGFKEDSWMREKRQQVGALLLANPEPVSTDEDEVEYPAEIVIAMGEYIKRAQESIDEQYPTDDNKVTERAQLGLSTEQARTKSQDAEVGMNLAFARIYLQGGWNGLFSDTLANMQGIQWGAYHQPKYDSLFTKINQTIVDQVRT